MRIHKEGYRTLLAVAFVLIVLNTVLYLLSNPDTVIEIASTLISLIIFIYFLQFFRNPSRAHLTDDNVLLSPADGKLVVVEEVTETEYFNNKKLQVSIFMSPYNVHSNRSPVTGVVTYVKYHPGKFLVAWHPKSSILNERSTIVIKTDTGEEILLRQIAGAVARRIVTYPSVGDRVNQGEEFGFIKFGSRVDIFLPVNTNISLEIGQKVKAGIDMISQDFGK